MPAGPQRLGPYRLLRELGRGGMGVVYEVERDDTGGRFALKTLTLGLGADPELAARFVREGQLAARLDHPHVVRTHAAEFGAQPWIVQDLLPGGSLRDRLRASGPLPVDEAVELVRKVALGLAHAHERGVLHRDVKPENVLLDEEGEPRLVDFGVARPTVAGASGPLTATGQVVGSPAFMAPEQALGVGVDARADVHAAGALLHTLLSGDPPFGGRSTLEVLEAVISKPPRPLRSLRPEVPAAVERVVLRALAKRPDERFPTALALAAALGECRRAGPRSNARVVPALVAASAASALLAALALVLAARAGPPPPRPGLPLPATGPPGVPLAELPAQAATDWPGWGPTFAAPTRLEVARESREGHVDTFLMILEAQPAMPSELGRATITMAVSRIAFQLEQDMVRVNYDSADPEKPSPPMQGMRELLDRALAARLSVDIVLRTGEVTAVRGMPNAPHTEIATLAAALPQVLHDDAVRGLLDNALHLFPEEPSASSLIATTWVGAGIGLRGARRVRRGDDGTIHHVLSATPVLESMKGHTWGLNGRAHDAQITTSGELVGDRIRSTTSEFRYLDEAREARATRFRFRLLADGG